MYWLHCSLEDNVCHREKLSTEASLGLEEIEKNLNKEIRTV